MRKLTIREYRNRLVRRGIEYEVVEEEFYGLQRSIKHKCKEGHIFREKPARILTGAKCPDCYWWRTNK